jgi:hypothetical protein
MVSAILGGIHQTVARTDFLETCDVGLLHHPYRCSLGYPHQEGPHARPQKELWDRCWLHVELLAEQERACDEGALLKH